MKRRLPLCQRQYLCWVCLVAPSPRFYARWLTTPSKAIYFCICNRQLIPVYYRSTGLDGTEKAFAKPIMMLLLMFLGMCPAGLLYTIHKIFFTKPEDRKDVRYLITYYY